MDKGVLIKSLKVTKNMVFTEKKIISSIKNGHQQLKESVFLETLMIGTEKNTHAKKYDNK